MYSFVASLCLLSVAYQASGHSYHLGKCPTVDPIPDFKMEKFLGKWYVIEKTNTGSSCLVNNYSKDPTDPEKFKIEQISGNFLLGLTSPDHLYHYTGDLTIPDPALPGAMRVKFPLNVIGGATYTIFSTDYDTYAGVFTCQQLNFAHRRSVSLLSRNTTLDNAYITKIRSRLIPFGVDPYNLSIIRHTDCKYSDSKDVESTTTNRPKFMRPGNIGFKPVADLPNKPRGDHETSNEELNIWRNPKDDAEWLP